MMSIGRFAALGRVSVRMLRHYDALGLLRPVTVDQHSGYRFYEVSQLRQLNRLLALKDLGFSLEQVRDILDAKVEVSELRGMLRLRKSQLAEQIAADRDRLVRIEARLRMIESEGVMSTRDIAVKSVESIRFPTVSGTAVSAEHEVINPVVEALFGELVGAIEAAGAHLIGPPVAEYRPTEDGGLAIRVGFPVDGEVDSLPTTELPALPEAASFRYAGVMAGIDEGYQTLVAWIEDQGYRTDGISREVYLVSYPEPEENWVTELQMPVFRS